MKAGLRLIDFLRDSPTYGRDRANLISGFSIGMTGLMLNGAVMMLVLPLMLDPDDRDFRDITENVEFGQLLALILLGGATAFATLLIPLRLVSVFWGPRTGRYFDQIVLSGISPLRFVIGKAVSQNLFLGLILFLLLPYLVLSVTLGGVDLSFFLAGVFLIWLYCMALALVTLWASLYLNELLAAGAVIAGASALSAFGCMPLPFQPFVMTPFPALIHPLYSSIPFFGDRISSDFIPVFTACAVCMTSIIVASLFAIYLGPLYGIIRENSTFGEVVRVGDSKRKRFFRLRLHIQRPSEIAFFYENRSHGFGRSEGLLRWGTGLGGLLLLSAAFSAAFLYVMKMQFAVRAGSGMRWWIYEFHMIYLMIHGFGLAFAVFVFSHARNSTYLKVPFVFGRMVEVARLDTIAFLFFLAASTAASIATPFYFEQMIVSPAGQTIFPDLMYVTTGPPADYRRIAIEGTLVISVGGLLVYTSHRLVCLTTWLRSVSFVTVGIMYLIFVCLVPLFVAMLFLDVPELRRIQMFSDTAPTFAMASPFTVMMYSFDEMGSRFSGNVSTAPFYVGHVVLTGMMLVGVRRRGRKLRELYFAAPARGTK